MIEIEIAPRAAACSADSIIGVTYYSREAPTDFGAFNDAFVFLFKVTL